MSAQNCTAQLRKPKAPRPTEKILATPLDSGSSRKSSLFFSFSVATIYRIKHIINFVFPVPIKMALVHMSYGVTTHHNRPLCLILNVEGVNLYSLSL